MRRAEILDFWVKRDRLHTKRDVHVVEAEKAAVAAEIAGVAHVGPLGEPITIAKVDWVTSEMPEGVVNLYAVGIDS